jgi:chromosome partitioning protein
LTRILAIANQKGGVGKTTTSINLAASLVVTKRKVLLVDLDPQGNATMGSGVDKDDLEFTVYDLLVDEVPLQQVIQKSPEGGFDVLPANGDLTAAEVGLLQVNGREQRLKKSLANSPVTYDYVIIDCPPSLNMLTLNGLVAANGVIIPMQCEYFALEGLSALVNTVGRVSATVNKSLKIEGIVRTMYDPRNSLTRDVTSQLTTHFGDQLYRTVIPRNVRLAEAPSYGLPALHYDKQSKGAIAYLALAGEVLRRSSAAASAVTATVDSAPVRADKSSAAVTTAAAGEYDAS